MIAYIIDDGGFGLGRSFYKDTVYVTKEDAERELREGQKIVCVEILTSEELKAEFERGVRLGIKEGVIYGIHYEAKYGDKKQTWEAIEDCEKNVLATLKDKNNGEEG